MALSRDIEETKKNLLGWKRGEVENIFCDGLFPLRITSFDLNGGIVDLLDRVKYCFNGNLTHLFQAKVKYILMDNFNLQDIANSVFLPTADVLTSVFLLTACVLTYLSDKR